MGREAHLKVWEESEGPPGGPGGVGTPTRGLRGVGRPTWRSWWGLESHSEVRRGREAYP